MAGKTMADTARDYFIIKEIECGKRKAGTLLADTDKDIYFESGGQLFSLPKQKLWRDNAKLENAALVKTPDGRISGLMAFNGKLLLVLEQEGKARLTRLEKGEFINVADLAGPVTAWTLSENKDALFLLLNTAKGPEISCLDKNFELKPICLLSEKGLKLYSITQADGRLFLSGSVNGKGVLITIKIIADDGSLLTVGKDAYEIQYFPSEIFKAAYNGKRGAIASLDGRSEILTDTGKTIFSDIAGGDSGYQLACLISPKTDQDYIIAGSWRRSDEHPRASFYFLKNGRVIFKYNDLTPLKDTGKWTGYDSQNGSYADLEEIYIPCYGSSILAIKRLDPASPHFNEQIRQASIAHADSESMLFVKMARDPFHKTTEDKSGLQSSTTFNYAGYFLPAMPKEKTRFYITYDVEQHVPGEPYCLTGEGLGRSCGLYWIMDELEKYGLRGTFFVNIYDHVNFKEPVLENIIQAIHSRGHEVGLHSHRNDPSLTPYKLPFYTKTLPELSKEEQRTVLKYGRDFIEKITGEAPVSFRAGSFRLNDTTLEVLEELGFLIDSSFCMNRMLPNLTFRSKNRPFWISDKLLEMPLTVTSLFNRGEGAFKFPLVDINWHYQADELLEVIQSCREQGLNDLLFLGHSFSFIRFTNDRKKSPYDFKFSGDRYILGPRDDMMEEYDKFLAALSANKDIEFKLLRDAPAMTDIGASSDIIPSTASSLISRTLCPVCGKQVDFQPYGGRSKAMCPVCRSVERVRFKYLYLKHKVGIENRKNYSILHIGPNLKIQEWLKSLPGIDHISADPFNPADLKFHLEDMPFAENTFDMLICIGVLEHVLDDWKALENMYKVLKPGSELLLYVGPLYREETLERYNREEFPIMEAFDFHTPADLDKPEVLRKDGKVYYNPAYTTREYGMDFLEKLKEFGFKPTLLRARDLFHRPELYGIREDQNLLSCIKE